LSWIAINSGGRPSRLRAGSLKACRFYRSAAAREGLSALRSISRTIVREVIDPLLIIRPPPHKRSSHQEPISPKSLCPAILVEQQRMEGHIPLNFACCLWWPAPSISQSVNKGAL
jgi:hypothetical protein